MRNTVHVPRPLRQCFQWRCKLAQVKSQKGLTYTWNAKSTYVQKPTFFDGLSAEPTDVAPVTDARILALLGDSITTDHISPAGSIKADSPAGKYLSSKQGQAA